MRSELSWDILKRFSGNDQDCFSFQDVLEEYPDRDNTYLSKVLSKMLDSGMLIKLDRGLFCIVPLSSDAKNYLPDWHLVAKYLTQGKPYYIGYYSAMQIHGLTTQPGLKEIVVIKHRVTPSSKIIQGVEFQFVTQTPARFFGYKNTWINRYSKAMVSDLEKTIVDAVTRPQLCSGMVEVGKAIYESRDQVNQDQLFNYFIKNDNQTAIKRYLFVCHLFDHWSAKHEGLLQKVEGAGFSSLDPAAPDQGRKNSRFGLKVNVDTDTIVNGVYT